MFMLVSNKPQVLTAGQHWTLAVESNTIMIINKCILQTLSIKRVTQLPNTKLHNKDKVVEHKEMPALKTTTVQIHLNILDTR